MRLSKIPNSMVNGIEIIAKIMRNKYSLVRVKNKLR